MKRETTIVTTSVLALTLMGVLMVYSASAVGADGAGKLFRQLVYVGAGLCALLLASRFDYHRFRDGAVFRGILIIVVLLLIAVLIPGVGKKVDGARRWIQLGGFGFQPSELAKFALIVLLAVKLTANRAEITRFKFFAFTLILVGMLAGLVAAQRDLGVPMVLIAVMYIMMCAAGAPWRYLMGSVLPVAGLGVLLIVYFPHRIIRIIAFLNPWDHRDGASFQLIQSLSAFAQGAVWGRGGGASEQKLYYLPAAHTDFIFAVVGEEFGLMGTLLVLSLFAALLFAGMRIALNARDQFGSLLAVGITGLIVTQATFIMAVTTGLLPTKGLPLPFISFGGTALIVFLGLVGVLVNVGAQADPSRRARAA